MDKVNSQTAKVSSYETSRTRRTLVDGNIHSEDLNNVSDEEYATSGFYVREKSNDKKQDSSATNSPKPVLNGEGSNGTESNSMPYTPKEKTTNGDENIVSENNENSDNADQKDQTEATESIEQSKDTENETVSEKPAEVVPEDSDLIENEVSDGDPKDNTASESGDNDPKEGQENPGSNSSNEDDNPEKDVPGEVPESMEETSHTPEKEEALSTPAKEEQHSVDQTEDKTDKDELQGSSEDKSETAEPTDDKAKASELAEEKSETAEPIEDKAKAAELTEDKSETAEPTEDNAKAAELTEDKSETPEPTKDVSNTIQEEKTVNEDTQLKKDEPEKMDEKIEKESDAAVDDTADDKEKERNKANADTIESDDVVEVKDSKVETAKVDLTATEGDKAANSDLLNESEIENRKKKDFIANLDLTQGNSPTKSKTNGSPEKSTGSILKSHLSARSESECQDTDMEDDFDPSLFCPDISMDVDEVAPVVTNENHVPEDSDMLYSPIFSTLVDDITGAEVEVGLTPEEMEMRSKMYGPDNPVQKSKVHCTACNVHLGSALTGANNRFVHPLLKVLICKNCYHFYTSGEFEKDEDGSELYCRWCGQGGQVLCCSSCEYVFCKRCIKNNFGLKKFKEIRNSDDWNCFRCDPGQLSKLRASCAEFMEYYRTEMARAYSLSSEHPELMTTDYTTCCSNPPEKKEDADKTPATPRPKRKRKDDDDPDYSPMVLAGEPPPKKPVPATGPGYTVISSPSMVVRPIAPKPMMPPGNIRPTGAQPGVRPQLAQTFKVGNTIFRSRNPGSFTIQRPEGARNPGYITIPSSGAGKAGTPGYIKLLPQSRMSAPIRAPSGTFTLTPGAPGRPSNFTPVRPTKPPTNMPTMKHEWFEKTVRAAARVNSNLSYTLTQLNRQQSQASNVEALAVVHNKLQEVLSTSINSLIQIRKNLRTEFIAGIRNVKFPPKPAPAPPPPSSGPIVVKDDDDVIFVSQPSATTPVTSMQPPPLILSPSVTLSKKPSIKLKPGNLVKIPTATVTPMSVPKKAPTVTSTTTTAPSFRPPTGFLKVRSLTALQNVPPECIIIPDDPPEPPRPRVVEVVSKAEVVGPPEPKQPPELTPKSKESSKSKEDDAKKAVNIFMIYNVLKRPSVHVRKMMNAVVNVERSLEMEKLLEEQRSRAASNN